MTEVYLLPTLERQIRELQVELARLRRRGNTWAVDTGTSTVLRLPFAYLFTYSGPLVAGDSPIPPLWHTGRLSVVRIQPQNSASTNTTLQVKRNGTALTALDPASSTVTVPGGSAAETTARFGGDAHLFNRIDGAAADQLKITIVTAGTGAVGLTILVDFT